LHHEQGTSKTKALCLEYCSDWSMEQLVGAAQGGFAFNPEYLAQLRQPGRLSAPGWRLRDPFGGSSVEWFARFRFHGHGDDLARSGEQRP